MALGSQKDVCGLLGRQHVGGTCLGDIHAHGDGSTQRSKAGFCTHTVDKIQTHAKLVTYKRRIDMLQGRCRRAR